jgi:hypothetical protein
MFPEICMFHLNFAGVMIKCGMQTLAIGCFIGAFVPDIFNNMSAKMKKNEYI